VIRPREVLRYLETEVSKFLVIIARRCIRYNILFGRDPECKEMDIEDRRNKEYPLKGDNRRAFNGMLIDCINNRRVVTGKTNCPPAPQLMPQKESMEDRKHLFPVDFL
jgi:hypothetical protein